MAVPKLRFKTDDGSEFPEWEKTRLCTLMSFKNGITASREQFGKGIKCISVLDILNNHYIVYDCIKSSVEIDDELIRNFSVEYGDFVFQRSSENVEDAGRANVYLDKTKKAVFSGFVIRGKKISNYEPLFINELLRTFFVRKQIMHKAQGAQHINIGQEILNSVVVYLPSLPEQKKIASFLLTIDDIINQTQSELTAWQERKKGVMQKIFNREVRFKADDGSEFPEWEEKTFSEILSENKIPIPKPTNGYERLGIRSHGKGTFHEYVPAGEGLDVDTMYVVEAHNLILNITFAWEQAIAITDNEDDGKLVSHRFPQYKFNDGFDWHYFKYDILDKKLKHELGLASPGGAGRNRVLNKSDFLRIKRVVPCLDEQKKIADCLSSLDDVINQIKAELSAWKEFKKGLLQQMFV